MIDFIGVVVEYNKKIIIFFVEDYTDFWTQLSRVFNFLSLSLSLVSEYNNFIDFFCNCFHHHKLINSCCSRI